MKTLAEQARDVLHPTDWMAGMRAVSGIRISRVGHYPGGIRDDDGRVRPANDVIRHDECPDLDDEATVLCLVAIARRRADALLQASALDNTATLVASSQMLNLAEALHKWVMVWSERSALATLAEAAVVILAANPGTP
jgi:hypothetical protein